MKLLYVANIRLPTEKAHGIQIMKTCEALAKAGAEVELCVTDRATPIQDDPFAYYHIRTPFTLTRLPVLDLVEWGKLGFYLESLSFARAARRVLGERRVDIVYGRDEFVLARLAAHVPFVWETHTGSWNSAAKCAARRARLVVAISQGLKDFYIERGVPAEKILVAHDGVDPEQFGSDVSQGEARAKLGLAPGKPLVVYTGSESAQKGVPTLRAAAERLPQVELLVVSGKPHKEIPLYLRAADLVVLPNSAATIVSERFTSPMKLFEYMASGTPILASDLPSTREVLDEESASFARPDDPADFVRAIKEALADPGRSVRAVRAKAKVRDYTWDARARTILHSLA